MQAGNREHTTRASYEKLYEVQQWAQLTCGVRSQASGHPPGAVPERRHGEGFWSASPVEFLDRSSNYSVHKTYQIPDKIPDSLASSLETLIQYIKCRVQETQF